MSLTVETLDTSGPTRLMLEVADHAMTFELVLHHQFHQYSISKGEIDPSVACQQDNTPAPKAFALLVSI